MTDEELVEDGEAIGGLERDGAPPEVVKQSLECTVHVPAAAAPVRRRTTRATTRVEGGTGWTVAEIDNAAGTVVLRRGQGVARRARCRRRSSPAARTTRRRSGRRFAAWPARCSPSDGRYPHLERLLRREPPLGGAPVQRMELEEQRDARSTASTSTYLVVQGPPGSGKTYRGARLITRSCAPGSEVGVAAQSHKVIHNLLDEVERAAGRGGARLPGRQAGRGVRRERSSSSRATSTSSLDPEVTLVAGTAWLFAREELDGTLDTLVVDEAGQYLARRRARVGTSARRLVLLGDPLQLAQVTQGVHPRGSGASVLEHLLGEHETIPEDRGIFLEQTRRMHPDVCRFVSEAFYEGRLDSIAECAERTTSLTASGSAGFAVEHEGNRVESEEEADAIAAEIERAPRPARSPTRDGDAAAPRDAT